MLIPRVMMSDTELKSAKTIELEEKEKNNKVEQMLYHTDEIISVMSDVAKSYMEDVSLMKDEELGYDRNSWMKKYGDGTSGSDENTYDVDIHTIAILCEQVRRFGRIYYDDMKNKPILDGK